MNRLLAVGALAWDRVLRLSDHLSSGARLSASTLDATAPGSMLPGRLGGGAANAAVAWANSGWQASVAGLVSTDGDGEAVLDALSGAGIDVSAVQRSDIPSPVTLILVEHGGERTILGVKPAKAPDYRARAAILSNILPDLIGETGVAGVFLRAAIQPGRALPTTLPVLAHWDGGPVLPGADIVIASSADIETGNAEQAFEQAKAFCGPRMTWMVLTLGGDGAEAFGSGRRIRIPAAPAIPVDATGAGDIFAAGLLDAVASGADMEEALRHAAVWGARAVELEGSAPLAAGPGTFRRFRP